MTQLTAKQIAEIIIADDEGYSESPVYDTLNRPVYGMGFVCGEKGDPLPDLKIRLDTSKSLLSVMVEENYNKLSTNFWYVNMDVVRQATLLNIAHQVGVNGVYHFKKMIGAMQDFDYELAAEEAMHSNIACGDLERWKRNAFMIKTGDVHPLYNIQGDEY